MTILCIARPDDRFLRRRIMTCPEEGRRRRFVARYEVWYSTTFYCCGCGDVFDTDALRRERPFERGWRQRAIALHRKMYEGAPSGPPPSLEEMDPDLAAEMRGAA